MNEMEWAKCSLALKAYYSNTFKIDDNGMCFWFDALKDLPGELVLGAIVHMAKTTRAFPSVAEIREIAEIKPGADIAWTEVLKNLNRYVKPKWSNPLIGQAVDQLGGIVNICNAEESTIGMLRSQFIKAFSQLDDRERIRDTYRDLGIDPAVTMLEASKQKSIGDGKAVR